jgi:hypothetical protein
MNKKFFAVFGILAAVATLGASCGGGGPTAGGTESALAGKTISGVDDVCNYFPKELVEEAIGRPIVKTEGPAFSSEKSCTYYTDWDEGYYGGRLAGGGNVVAFIEDKNVEAAKTEIKESGYTLGTDSAIAGDHYTVINNTKKVWRVDLILGPEKFLRIKANHSAVTGEELVKIAAKFAEKLK